jgi:hypothetical protein
MTYYQNFSQYQMNKEVTRIIKLIIEDENNDYSLLSQKDYDLLVSRVRELELRLNTSIVIDNQ